MMMRHASSFGDDWGISRLPTDCLTEVFTFLDHRTVFLRVTITCEDWRSLLQDEDNREFWVGRICSKLYFPNSGDASGWVESAVLNNGDKRVSPTYFLLVHYLEKILRGKAPVRLTTRHPFDSVFNSSSSRTVLNRSLMAEISPANYSGRLLVNESSTGDVQGTVFVLGCNGEHRVVNATLEPSPEALTEFLTKENAATVAVGSDEGGDHSAAAAAAAAHEDSVAHRPLLFMVESGRASRGQGWVANGTKPWSALSEAERTRAALATIFNIMVSQDLLNGAQHGQLTSVAQKDWRRGLLTVQHLLDCVLDSIGLRCLLQFDGTGNDREH